jgi:Ca2+-binding EF-hand superfamily protein
MKQFGYEPSEEDIMHMINNIDKDKNGAIELDEFLNFIERYPHPHPAKPQSRRTNVQNYSKPSRCSTRTGMG